MITRLLIHHTPRLTIKRFVDSDNLFFKYPIHLCNLYNIEEKGIESTGKYNK
jgi:hypothetical protein